MFNSYLETYVVSHFMLKLGQYLCLKRDINQLILIDCIWIAKKCEIEF